MKMDTVAAMRSSVVFRSFWTSSIAGRKLFEGQPERQRGGTRTSYRVDGYSHVGSDGPAHGGVRDDPVCGASAVCLASCANATATCTRLLTPVRCSSAPYSILEDHPPQASVRHLARRSVWCHGFSIPAQRRPPRCLHAPAWAAPSVGPTYLSPSAAADSEDLPLSVSPTRAARRARPNQRLGMPTAGSARQRSCRTTAWAAALSPAAAAGPERRPAREGGRSSCAGEGGAVY